MRLKYNLLVVVLGMAALFIANNLITKKTYKVLVVYCDGKEELVNHDAYFAPSQKDVIVNHLGISEWRGKQNVCLVETVYIVKP